MSFSIEENAFVLDNMPCCGLVHDKLGKIQFVNKEAQTFFSLSRDTILYEKSELESWRLLDSEGIQLELHQLPVAFVIKNKKAYPPRLLGYKPPSGDIKWCLVRAVPNFDANDDISAVIVMFTDETQNQKLLNKVTDDQTLLQKSETILNAGSWIYDISSNEVQWSDNIFKIFGISKKRNLMYHEYLSLLNDEDRIDISTKVERAIQEGDSYEVTQTIRGKTIHGVGIPITDHFGKVIRLHGILRDISEEIEAKKKLEELALIIENTNNVVVVTDPLGNIKWANSGYTKLTGYSLAESIGKKPGSLLQGPDTDPQTVKLISKAVRERKPITTEILNYSKDGRPYWLHMNIQPIFDKEGRCMSLAAIELDLTERRTKEEQLKKVTKQLNEALREKDKFYSILTHDLRSPFNGLIGLSELVIEDYEHMDKSKIVKTVEKMHKISENTLHLLDDFLVWIASKAKLQSPKIEKVDLVAVIYEIQVFFRDIASLKEIDIKIEAPSSLVVNTNIDCLKTILRNLVSNAIKFSSKGNHIVIIADCSTLEPTLTVRDFGQGMSEREVLDFQEYGQIASQVGSSGEKGYGLGLRLVKDLCSTINASIALSSMMDNGTTFTIKFPKDDSITLQAS